jgi:ArsR family transcriptional regulator
MPCGKLIKKTLYISDHGTAKGALGSVTEVITTAGLLAALKAAGEATRLRILALLSRRELNVRDLAEVLQQSQPRISRHLRLLAEAGLIERFREGSFVYCRLNGATGAGGFVNAAVARIDRADPILVADRRRADAVQEQREKATQVWFHANAAKWDQIRSLYVEESRVEAAMLDLLGGQSIDVLVDLGTGTGRLLELFAGRARQAIGIDASHSMLEYARLRLARLGFEHCQLRQGNLTDLAYPDDFADVVILHQVLHHLVEPEQALRESARILKPGGRLLIVDFAPHDLDFLREQFAHERLGFADEPMRLWLEKCGLAVQRYEQFAFDEAERKTQHLTVALWLAVRPAGAGRGGETRMKQAQGETNV